MMYLDVNKNKFSNNNLKVVLHAAIGMMKIILQ